MLHVTYVMSMNFAHYYTGRECAAICTGQLTISHVHSPCSQSIDHGLLFWNKTSYLYMKPLLNENISVWVNLLQSVVSVSLVGEPASCSDILLYQEMDVGVFLTQLRPSMAVVKCSGPVPNMGGVVQRCYSRGNIG